MPVRVRPRAPSSNLPPSQWLGGFYFTKRHGDRRFDLLLTILPTEFFSHEPFVVVCEETIITVTTDIGRY